MAQFAIDEILTTGIQISGFIFDVSNSIGPTGYVLTSTSSGVMWKLNPGSEEVQATGTLLNNRINSLSGYVNGTFISGSGIRNYVPRWNSARELVTGSIYDLGTGVGIGITNVSSKLEIVHDSGVTTPTLYVKGGFAGNAIARFERIYGVTAGTTYVDINGSSSNPQLSIIAPNNAFALGVNNTTSAFEISDNSTIGTNTRLLIDISGNVGIGTINPPSKLAVQGDINVNYNTTGENSVWKTFVTNHSPSNRGASLLFGMYDGAAAGVKLVNTVSSNTGYNSQYISFITHEGGVSVDERVRITPLGYVGIGTNSPISLLSVGNAGSTTSANGITFGGDSSANLYRSAAGALKIDGSLGIGINPVQKFQVEGVVGNPASGGVNQSGIIRISNTTDNAVLDFGIRGGGLGAWIQSTDETSLAANYSLLLNPNGGSVGIGVSNPSGQLHLRNMGFTDQTAIPDTNSFPNATGIFGLILDHNAYSDGRYRHRFVKVDRSANLPLYLQQAGSTADQYINLVRFGTHSQSTNTFEVFGDSRINGTANITSNLLVSGNAGIGIGNPGYKLDVIGSIRASGELISEGNNARISLFRSNGINYFDWANGQSLYFSTESSVGGAGRSTLMSITSGGNVGIGTVNAIAQLHLGGSPSLTNDPWMVLDINDTYFKRIIFSEDRAAYGPTGYGGYIGYDANNNMVSLGTYHNTGEFRSLNIKRENGNVGIGTTVTPLKLNVSGSIYMAAGSGSAISWSNDISSQFLKYDSVTDGMVLSSWAHTTFLTQQTERVRIASNGNVGIGVTNPTTLLQLKGDAGSHQIFSINRSGSTTPAVYIGTDGNQNALIASNNTNLLFGKDFVGVFNEYARIASNGNFGIGTSNPNAKLHIENSGTVSSIATVRLVGSTGNNAGSQIEFYKAQNPKASIGLASAVTGGISDDLLLLSSNPNSIILAAGSSGLAVFESDGKVGIGMYDPVSLLSIGGVGSTSAASGLTFGQDAQANIYRSAEDTIKTDGSLNIASNLTIGADLYVADELGVGVPIANKRFNYGAEIEVNSASIQLVLGRLGNSTGQGAIGADSSNVFAVWNVSGGLSKPFVITQQGNVGIGTDIPSSRLSVSGAIESLNDNGGEGGQLILRGNTYRYSIDNYLGQGLRFFREDDATTANGLVLMQIASGGNVGINNSSPGSLLDIRFPTNPATDNGAGNNVLRLWTSAAANTDVGGAIGLGGQYSGGLFQSFGQIAGRKSNATLGNNAGYLQFATTNNGGTMNEWMRIDAGGSVGIGTTNPTYKLDVYQTTNDAIIRSKTTAAGAYVYLDTNIAGYYGLNLLTSGTSNWFLGAYGGTNDLIFTRGINGTEYVRLTTAGNVGIGTASIIGKLDVYDNTNGPLLSFVRNANTGANAYSAFVLRRDGNNNGIVLFTNSSARSTDGGAGNSTIRTDYGNLNFGAGGSQHILTTGGNVGIGTNNPTQKLEVNGTVKIQSAGTYSDPTDNAAFLNYDTIAGIFTLSARSNAGNTYMAFRTSNGGTGSEKVRITNNGFVGISSNAPTDFLDFGGAGKNIVFGYAAYGEILNSAASIVGNNVKASPTANSQVRRFANATDQGNFIKLIYNKGITFHTNITSALNTDISEDTNERMRIDLSGNVGIGTITPSGRLHVVESSATGSRIQLGTNIENASMNAGLTNDLLILNAPYGTNSATVSNSGAKWGIKFIGTLEANQFNSTTKTSAIYAVSEDPTAGYNRGTSLAFYTNAWFDQAYTERMRIFHNGNIGIGTTQPSYKLQIVGSGTPASPTVLQVAGLNNDGGDAKLIIAQSPVASDLQLLVAGTDTRSDGFTANDQYILAGQQLNIFNRGNGSTYNTQIIVGRDGGYGNISFSTAPQNQSATIRMYITSGGNVGIGTSNPVELLDLYGSASRIKFHRGGAYDMSFGMHDSTFSALSIKNASDASTLAYFQYDGNVGIGTIAPTGVLTIHSNATQLRLQTASGPGAYFANISSIYDSAHPFTIAVANNSVSATEFFGIYADGGGSNNRIGLLNGNVGIGTTVPTGLLNAVRNSNTAQPIASFKEVYGSPAATNVLLLERLNNLSAANQISSNAGLRIRDHSSNYSLSVEDHLSNVNFAISGARVMLGSRGTDSLLNIGGIGSALPASGITFGQDPQVNLYRIAEDVLRTDANLNVLGYVSVGGYIYTSAYIQVAQGNIYPGGYTSDLNLNIGNTAGNNWETAIKIKPGSYVGIGTTQPSGKLHVVSTVAGETVLRADGTNGTLFSVTDDLSDSLMSVNNSAGLPVLEVFADDRVVAGQYGSGDLVVTNNRVGIGRTSPGEKLDVNGSIRLGVTISNTIGTSAVSSLQTQAINIQPNSSSDTLYIRNLSAGNYQLQTVTASANGGSLHLQPYGGNVGVGTTAPVVILDVVGPVGSFPTGAGTTTVGVNLRLRNSDSNLVLDIGGNGGSGNWLQSTSRIDLSLGYPLLLNPNGGNVGIGTNAPNAKLDVVGSIYLDGSIRNTWGNRVFNVAQFPSNSSTSPTYAMGLETDSTSRILYISNKNNDGSATDPNGGIIFRTGGTPSNRMIISYSGNVGVGTTNPASKLHIYNSAGSSTVASNAIAVFEQNSNAGIQVCVPDASEAGLFFSRNGAAYYSAITRNATDLLFKNNSATAVTIASSLNVGIGNTIPGHKLSVQGEIAKYSLTGYDGFFDNVIKYGIPGDFQAGALNTNRWIGLDASITAGAAVSNVLRVRSFGGGNNNNTPVNVADFRGDQTTYFYSSVGIGTSSPSTLLSVGTVGSTTAANGLTLGGDTIANLYRSAASTIKTDGSLIVNGNLTTNLTTITSLNINAGTLNGIPAGSTVTGFTYAVNNGNVSQLNLVETRFATGSDWTTASTRIQKRIDVTNQAYIEFNPSGSTYGLAFGVGTANVEAMRIASNGTVGIGTTSTSYKLQVIGSFAATTKSFDIVHPTISGKRLIYASLEGPENGVYFRGKNNDNEIILPHYWSGLVHEDSITVNLTSIGKRKDGKIRNYSVDQIGHNKVYIYTDSDDNIYNYYYTIFAERKDVSKLVIERDME